MGKYWERVCAMQKKQTDKGIEEYGQVLEQNTKLKPLERITYMQEELIDALMYAEHLKELLSQTMVLAGSADDYQQAALRTTNVDYDGIMQRIQEGGEPLLRLLNGALGLAGESGEVADHLKKYIFQGHELDKQHLSKELGDISWYLATSAHALGIPLSTIFDENIAKLRKRYPEGFSMERSINREE